MDTMPEPRDAADALAEIHRAEWGRIVAGLARRFGDLDLAEEVAADAFAVAVERWAADGVPPNPGAWITTTAHRRAIDRLRREARRDDPPKRWARSRMIGCGCSSRAVIRFWGWRPGSP